jgi:hypothetical protein
MTDSFKREIERLLEEPDGQPEADRHLLRARLAATLSEGLDEAKAASSSRPDLGDIGSIAAFIDGRLTGDVRDEFVTALAERRGLRADVASSTALVQAVASNPVQVPKHLMARANAQFAPAPVVRLESRWRLDLSAFLPRRRIAWAMVAALALIVATPAGLMLSGRYGGPQGGGEPELSSVPAPELSSAPADETPKDQKSCEEKLKEKAEKAKTGPSERSPASAQAPKDDQHDPCDHPGRDGSTDK